MKPRPRSVERKVASWMSMHFANMDLSAVERIPILGREGPDITINESGLAIDVKSRKSVPVCFSPVTPCRINESPNRLLTVRLADFPLLYTDQPNSGELLFPSRQVKKWFDHMKEWADQNHAIPALVLHIPGKRIDSTVFVIHAGDRAKLKERYRLWQDERLQK